MAVVLKRCEHDSKQWGKCEHSWTVRYWDPQAGKQKERSFKRNHAAAKAFSKTIEADKLSVHGAPKPVTFGEYVGQTWLPALALRRKPGTVRIYTAVLRNHLLPALGTRQLAAVAADREGVTAFLAGLSPGTARDARTCISAVLTEAVKAGRISEYRLTGIELPEASGAAEFVFPAHSQLMTLAAEMGSLAPAIWIMRGCGLRPGEVLAVKREQFLNGKLRLTEQVQESPHRYCPLKARKPGEYRDIPVPPYVKAVIADLQPGYLFPDVTTSVFGHAFRKAAGKAGLPGFHPHSLRHVFASVALENGIPITSVSRWLGHRSIEVTFRIYSHFVPDSFDTAAEVLQAEYELWSA